MKDEEVSGMRSEVLNVWFLSSGSLVLVRLLVAFRGRAAGGSSVAGDERSWNIWGWGPKEEVQLGM